MSIKNHRCIRIAEYEPNFPPYASQRFFFPKNEKDARCKEINNEGGIGNGLC